MIRLFRFHCQYHLYLIVRILNLISYHMTCMSSFRCIWRFTNSVCTCCCWDVYLIDRTKCYHLRVSNQIIFSPALCGRAIARSSLWRNTTWFFSFFVASKDDNFGGPFHWMQKVQYTTEGVMQLHIQFDQIQYIFI